MAFSSRWFLAAVVLGVVGILVASPALAQRDSQTFKSGDRVEVKDFDEWKEGTVVEVRGSGRLIEVRLDKSDLPGDVPDDIRDRMRTRPFPVRNVRPLRSHRSPEPTAAASSVKHKVRKWTDRTGKFSVQARFHSMADSTVVLVRNDGKQIRVPLDKLSEGDAGYVHGIMETKENPFQVSSDASLPVPTGSSDQTKEANWRDAKLVQPQSFSKWSYAPPKSNPDDLRKLADLPDVQMELPNIPDSKKFFEKVLGMFISDNGDHALVCRQKGQVGGDLQQFVELLDLKKEKSGGLIPLPTETAMLDAFPDEHLVMYRPEAHGFGKKTMLTIARLEASQLTPIHEWEPYAHESWEPKRDIEIAWFLSSDRVLTINEHGEALTVWDVPYAKALLNIPVRSSIGLKMALSPDRSLLAVVMSEGIAIIDLEAGEHVATLPTDGESFEKLAFRADNRRLAAISDQCATLWDLTDGQELRVFYHPVLRRSSEIAWAGEYLLVDNEYLFDLERRILLWQYEGMPGKGVAAKVHHGRMWAVPNVREDKQTVLISTAMPHPGALREAERLPSPEELLVVRPGAPIAIETDIDPAVGSADEIRESIAEGLKAAGYNVVAESKLVVKATCKPQEQQTIRVNMDGRWPRRESDYEERTITPHASYLEMTLRGERLWRRGYLARPGGAIWFNKDETLDQALERLTKPNLSVFENVKFSAYVARPGKATDNGAYGLSQFTPRGLVDGRSSGRRRIAFE